MENYLELVEAILWLLLVFKESPRLITFFPANVKFLNLYISSWLIDMFPGNEEPLWRAWGTTNMEEGWPGEWIRGELTFILCGLLCGRPVCEDLLSKFMAGRAPSKSPTKRKNHCLLIPLPIYYDFYSEIKHTKKVQSFRNNMAWWKYQMQGNPSSYWNRKLSARSTGAF